MNKHKYNNNILHLSITESFLNDHTPFARSFQRCLQRGLDTL